MLGTDSRSYSFQSRRHPALLPILLLIANFWRWRYPQLSNTLSGFFQHFWTSILLPCTWNHTLKHALLLHFYQHFGQSNFLLHYFLNIELHSVRQKYKQTTDHVYSTVDRFGHKIKIATSYYTKNVNFNKIATLQKRRSSFADENH